MPVPEVVAERRVATPLGQQRVAEVSFARIARFQQGIAFARIAGTDHRVEELQDEGNAGRLTVVLPRDVFGIGVTSPRLGGAGRQSQCWASKSAQCLAASQ